MTPEEVRSVVSAVLEEEGLRNNAAAGNVVLVDAVVLKAVAAILTSFGIEDDDRKELRADFDHLRKWRKSVEQAQSITFKVALTAIIGGLVGALWLGFKAGLGK